MEWNVPEGQAGFRCEISDLFNQFTVVKFNFIFTRTNVITAWWNIPLYGPGPLQNPRNVTHLTYIHIGCWPIEQRTFTPGWSHRSCMREGRWRREYSLRYAVALIRPSCTQYPAKNI